MRRPVVECGRIEYENVPLITFTFLFFIEAGLAFIAEQPALDHFRDELRHDEHLAFGIVGKIFLQVLHYVSKHVEADKIEGAKGGGLGTADCGSRYLVDFFDRVAIVEHRAHRHQRAEGADAIRDEVRAILRHDYAFAQTFVKKAEHRARDFRFRPFGANQFDQMHVTRRIEKMHAEKVGAKILRASLGELFERNAAGVRSDDRSQPALLLDLFVEAAFDFEILDYRFDYQVAVFQFRQIVFEVSHGNQ